MNCKVKYILTSEKWKRNLEKNRRVYDIDYISPTITTFIGGGTEVKISEKYRIRKLTPRECFRLMGFADNDFNKAEKVNSNSQLYKQAGNSICVNVLEEIFKEML